jgi:quinoprotein glucose dehydrogenase
MPTHESDVCIIGGGISAAMLARKLVRLKPGTTITIVEAGRSILDVENRPRYRDRSIAFGEHPWRNDFIDDQKADGIVSMTMALGGLALHWGGACNRFSVEDLRLRSMYGLAADWPLEWDDLERHYVEAEHALNVAGQPSAYAEDTRSAPYSQPAVPLSYNLQVLKAWAERSGLKFDPLPLARNLKPFDGRGACCVFDTCDICPTGARYSPDFTFRQLVEAKQVAIHDRTLVRRLVLDEKRPVVVAADGVSQEPGGAAEEYRARLFVVASGYCWSPHLLLLSANPRFPNGLANRSGLVGRYMTGHSFMEARVNIDDQTYPGQHMVHSLISREYFRCPPNRPFIRHDTRVWENAAGREPRLRDAQGKLLVGDEVFDDWRARSKGSSVRLRTYLDVHPSADSRLTLDPAARNRHGDPMPKIEHRFDEPTRARQAGAKQHVLDLFNRMARASNGKVVSTFDGDYLDHPAGGCRMGTDPATSVCDSYGRTHDHENLFVVGAPTLPTGGCTNGTLTFVALTLRSATKIAESL